MKPLYEELKDIRIEKGVSLEEIYDSTKIRVTMLEKIETGEFDAAPQPYMRAFLREYSAYLGLDPERTIMCFEGKISSLSAESDTESFSPPVIQKIIPEMTEEPDEEIMESVSTLNETTIEQSVEQKNTETVLNETPKQTDIPFDNTAASQTNNGSDTEKDNENDEQDIPKKRKSRKKESSGNPVPAPTESAMKKRVSYDNTVDTLDSEQIKEPVKRLVIEEPRSGNILFFGVFFFLIIIAAVIIFLINRGYL